MIRESNIYANGVRTKYVLYDVVLSVRMSDSRRRGSRLRIRSTHMSTDVNKRAQMLGIA